MTKREADEIITRLRGEARVMMDLMNLSLGVMETIVPESQEETDELDKLIGAFRAALSERRFG